MKNRISTANFFASISRPNSIRDEAWVDVYELDGNRVGKLVEAYETTSKGAIASARKTLNELEQKRNAQCKIHGVTI